MSKNRLKQEEFLKMKKALFFLRCRVLLGLDKNVSLISKSKKRIASKFFSGE